MKSLQERCGFDDLSITDEFIELIAHENIGVEVFNNKNLNKNSVVENIVKNPISKKTDNIHLKNQYYLTKIGLMRGYDVWVAFNDRNKGYNNENLNSIALKELPFFAGHNVMDIAKFIDVIWFKKGTAQPISFFEIEHTTSIYSGLLRLNDVIIDYPIPKAYIVGPFDRKKLFDSQIQRRTFVNSELSEICNFLTYEDVEKLMNAYKNIDIIL